MKRKFKAFIFIYCACFASFHASAMSNIYLKAGENVCAKLFNKLRMENLRIGESKEVKEAIDYLTENSSGELGDLLRSKNKRYYGPMAMYAVHAAMEINGEERIRLLSKLAKSRKELVKLEVAIAAGLIGGEGGQALLEQLIRNKSLKVEIAVARAAGRIGSKGG